MAKKATKKIAPKAVKKAAAKKTAAVKKAPATKKVAAAKKAPAKKAVSRKPVAKKASAPRASETRIIVNADIGFGNEMFIRGDNAGLSWESGTLLENSDASTWEWSSRSLKGTLEFKLLINDLVWSLGENFSVEAGQTVTINPEF